MDKGTEASSSSLTGTTMTTRARRSNRSPPRLRKSISKGPIAGKSAATVGIISSHESTTTIATATPNHDEVVPNTIGYGFWYNNTFYTADDTVGDARDASTGSSTSKSNTTKTVKTPLNVKKYGDTFSSGSKSKTSSTVKNYGDMLFSGPIAEEDGTVAATTVAAAVACPAITTTITTSPVRNKRTQTPIEKETPIKKRDCQKKHWKKEVGSVSLSACLHCISVFKRPQKLTKAPCLLPFPFRICC